MITNHVHYAPFTEEAIRRRTPYVRGHEIRWTYPLSKFATGIAEYLYLFDDNDEETGDSEWGYHVRRFGRRLLYENDQGFVWSERHRTERHAMAFFEQIENEYSQWWADENQHDI